MVGAGAGPFHLVFVYQYDEPQPTKTCISLTVRDGPRCVGLPFYGERINESGPSNKLYLVLQMNARRNSDGSPR